LALTNVRSLAEDYKTDWMCTEVLNQLNPKSTFFHISFLILKKVKK